MQERDEFKEYRGLSKDDAFHKIMSDVEIVKVHHLTFFMKYNSRSNTNEFVADFNVEDDTMYFSYLKVWGVFFEVFGMNNSEIKMFLTEMISNRFGLSVKPY